jgi:hypothetical protein
LESLAGQVSEMSIRSPRGNAGESAR